MAPRDYQKWNRSHMSRKPGSGRDGNVVLIGVAGVALIILLGFGLPRLMQRREPGLETAKTSDPHETEHAETKSKKKRISVFSDEEEPEEHAEKSAHAEKSGKSHSKKQAVAELTEHGSGLEAEAEEHEISEAPAHGSSRHPAGTARVGKALAAHGSDHSVASGEFCAPLEEPGRPAGDIKLTQNAWMPVVEDFRSAKRGIVEWVKNHPAQFPAAQLEEITARVMDLQIQRPPSQDEPDLAWRGGVVLSRMTDGKTILRVGGGFLALHSKEPARARFELARAVAMTLAPCELAKFGLADTWESALSCSNGYIKEGCETGSLSNQAWLIGSAIATETQSPGCRVRAVEKSGFLGCLKGHAPVAAAHDERVPVGVAALGREIASESKGAPAAVHGDHAAPTAKAADSHGHAEKAADSHGHAEKAADSHGHAEKVADSHGHAEKAADSHGHAEKAADSHGHAEKAADSHGHAAKAADSHGHAAKAADSHGHAEKAADSHGHAAKAADSHGHAAKAADSHGHAEKAADSHGHAEDHHKKDAHGGAH